MLTIEGPQAQKFLAWFNNEVRKRGVDRVQFKKHNDGSHTASLDTPKIVEEIFADVNARLRAWTRVEDRVPEFHLDVLVFTEYQVTEIGRYVGNDYFTSTCGRQLDKVTHWVPLPEAP